MKARSPTGTIPAPGSLVKFTVKVCTWHKSVGHVIPAGTEALVLNCTPRRAGGAVLDVLAGGVMTSVFDDEVSDAL
jgi:hypothetical protein